jgi:hypothetical protein
MRQGVCKLTGKRGRFVDSHLIPKALTRPEAPGLPFIQTGDGARPERRWSSWYDRELVIREGEDILSALDTWAISEMRKHKLVWSGWGPMQALTPDFTLPNTPYGIRKLRGIDSRRLRLFFLSLLWRAAASARVEFREASLPVEDVEQLRAKLLSGNSDPAWFYPIDVIQLSTLGVVHNQTPLKMTKVNPTFGVIPERRMDIVRFYFDGLMLHFHLPPFDQKYVEKMGEMICGNAEEELFVTTVTYEASFQRENLEAVQHDAYSAFPELIEKLLLRE